MDEEARVKYVNDKSALHLQDYLEQLENGELTEDDLLACAYGSMITIALLGFNLNAVLADAIAAADKLIDLLEKEELTSSSVCKNKDENGNCPLHNLHCQYPDCEKNS